MEKFVLGGNVPRYKHQREGLRKLVETRGVCALLFDPGTGKTATTLDYLSLLAFKNKVPGVDGVPEIRVLIISPIAAVDTWPLQAKEWASPSVSVWAEALDGSIRKKAEAMAARNGKYFLADGSGTKKDKYKDRMLHVNRSALIYSRRAGEPDPPEGKYIPLDKLGSKPRLTIISTNLDAFSSRSRYRSGTVADLMLEAVRRYDPDVVVVDESHKIKGVSSNSSRLLARIGKQVPRRIMLTGTVMPHSPLDVFAQWRFMAPTAFGRLMPGGTRKSATFVEFRAKYVLMGGFMGKQVVGFKNLDHMKEIMAKNSIAAVKSEALDLPSVSDVEVPVTLTPREKKAYAELKDSLATELREEEKTITATTPSRLAQMMKLRQITAGFLKDDDGVMHDIGSSKVKTITSIANDTLAGEKRIVIFAMFRREIDLLEKSLAQVGTEVMRVDGSTSTEARAGFRKRFGSTSDKRMILLAQISTMSVSVNELVTSSHAIFASMSLKRDEYIQARDRLNRIGQTRPVTFWHVNVQGSVDTVILDSHRKRTNLEEAVISHIMDAA